MLQFRSLASCVKGHCGSVRMEPPGKRARDKMSAARKKAKWAGGCGPLTWSGQTRLFLITQFSEQAERLFKELIMVIIPYKVVAIRRSPVEFPDERAIHSAEVQVPLAAIAALQAFDFFLYHLFIVIARSAK